mgnify:CR=1 FL=1
MHLARVDLFRFRVEGLCDLFVAIVAAAATGVQASGTEIKGVIATQSVDPGDFMNPKFTGTIDSVTVVWKTADWLERESDRFVEVAP